MKINTLRLFSALVILSILASCGNRARTVEAETTNAREEITADDYPVDKNDYVNIADSLKLEKGGGEIAEQSYTGILPCADCPDIRYDLTLYRQERIQHGVYSLVNTYLEADNGKDRSYRSYGKWEKRNGTVGRPDSDIYILTDYDSGEHMNFIFDGEDITFLDRDGRRIVSDHNYTLTRQ